MNLIPVFPPWRLASLLAVALVASCSLPSDHSGERENATLRLHLYCADLVILSEFTLDADEDVQPDLQFAMNGMKQSVARIRASGDSARAKRLEPLLARASTAVATLARTAPARREAHAAAEKAQETIPQLMARLDEVVRAMSDADARSSQLNIANREIVLADRMGRRIADIQHGGEIAVSAADALARDMAVFSQVLDAFRDGREEFGIARLGTPQERAALEALDKLRASFAQDAQNVSAALQAFEDARQAAEELHKLRGELYEAAPPRD
jgi:hypothetical protein